MPLCVHPLYISVPLNIINVPQCPQCQMRKVNIINWNGWYVGYESHTVLGQSQWMEIFMTHRPFALGSLTLSLGLSYDGTS